MGTGARLWGGFIKNTAHFNYRSISGHMFLGTWAWYKAEAQAQVHAHGRRKRKTKDERTGRRTKRQAKDKYGRRTKRKKKGKRTRKESTVRKYNRKRNTTVLRKYNKKENKNQKTKISRQRCNQTKNRTHYHNQIPLGSILGGECNGCTKAQRNRQVAASPDRHWHALIKQTYGRIAASS